MRSNQRRGNVIPSIVVGVALLVVCGTLVAMHVRTWRKAAGGGLDEDERNFFWRQYRRRMQSSVMIGIVGAAILGGQFVTSPLLATFYWLGTLLVVAWIMLLAVADAVSTRQHFSQFRRREQDELARLNDELRKIRGRRRNGKAAD